MVFNKGVRKTHYSRVKHPFVVGPGIRQKVGQLCGNHEGQAPSHVQPTVHKSQGLQKGSEGV